MADAQPRGGAVTRVPRRRLRDLGLSQHAAGLLQHRGARVGQRDAALGAIEEPHAELLLQLADLLAHGGLRDMQALGGATEVQFLRNGYEVPQVPEFH